MYNTNAFKWQDGTTTPVTKTATLTIAPTGNILTDVDGSLITFADKIVNASGTPQTLVALYGGNTLPSTITATYTANFPDSLVAVGDYLITATFALSDVTQYQWKNGTAPSAKNATLTIKVADANNISFSREVIPALVKSCSNGRGRENYDTTNSKWLTGNEQANNCHATGHSTHFGNFLSAPFGFAAITDILTWYNNIPNGIQYNKDSLYNRLSPKSYGGTAKNTASMRANNRAFYVTNTANPNWANARKVADTVADPVNETNPKTVDAILIQWINQGAPNN